MRLRVVFGLWAAVSAGWVWRTWYDRWPEMRIALWLAVVLVLLAAGRLAARWQHATRVVDEVAAARVPPGAVMDE